MRRSIIVVAYVVLGLLLFKFAFTYGYNEWVISKYEDEDYSENFALLEVMNVSEPYIVYYNNGNVMYQRMDYEAALEYYEKALDNNPPEGKECAIRINMALTKLKFLPEDYTNPEKIDDSIELLEDCLDILSEDDCANEYGDGHNNRAQRLYDEIKDILDHIRDEKEQQESQSQQQSDPSNQSDPSDSNQSGGQNGSDTQMSPEESQSLSESQESRQQDIEDELESKMSSAQGQRQRERKSNEENMEDWNWYYDDHPIW
ncbi:MAG: hypothetical protein J5607_05340 [Clostridiales bacterium]|nr:hypothetical protein [Clostridiales bacterium]